MGEEEGKLLYFGTYSCSVSRKKVSTCLATQHVSIFTIVFKEKINRKIPRAFILHSLFIHSFT